MNKYICPRCNKSLSKEELEDKICLECGCIFTVGEKKLKEYSPTIFDSRKMHYRKWIKLFILLLSMWAILTVGGIAISFAKLTMPWNIIITIILVLVYILIFVITQFHINMARDVHMLREKIKILEHKSKKNE